jgi:uncharacterized protein (DUF427 family)
MKIPGPDHPITITLADRRWQARFEGQVIANSTRALVLQEASYPPVIYFPREDVDIARLSRTDRSTHCPYKGDASYFSVGESPGGVNAVWTYETPFPAMAEIEGFLAFYADKLTVTENDA